MVERFKDNGRIYKGKISREKIVGYIWPQYYNLKSNPDYMKFIPAEKWDKILEGCYQYLDGAIIWSNGKDEDGQTDVAWNDPKVKQCIILRKRLSNDIKLT